MLPFCFEWVWDLGHVLFIGGLLFAPIGILGAGLTYCAVKAAYDTINDSGESHH